MNFGIISTAWASLEKTAKILILTESGQASLAEKIQKDNRLFVSEVSIIDIGTDSDYRQAMNALTEDDLLIALLTIDGYVYKGYNDTFSPFSKPSGLSSKYIFIRLDIPEASLLSGLNTSFAKMDAIIETCSAFTSGKTVRVTTAIGTDITTEVGQHNTASYHPLGKGEMAFLPPSEVWEDLVPSSTNGVIVVDVTVGELRFEAELIDPLGIVDQPVTITVKDGLVVDITGGDIAKRLKSGLDKLDRHLQMLVELGHGLSDLAPTGMIGVDESMNGSCHFGIGDRNPYHVDVVLSNPTITVLPDAAARGFAAEQIAAQHQHEAHD